MSIFKRKDRKSYYCKINGKFVRLCPERKKALAMWAELVADDTGPCAVTVRTLLKSYFKWLKKNRAEATWQRREYVFKLFANEYGKLKATQVKPIHVTQWADHHWGDKSETTRHDQMSRIQAAFNWGVRQGLINRHKLDRLEKPQRQVREEFVPVADWPKLLDSCSPAEFEQLVRFTLLTGIRPQESRILEASHVKQNRLVFEIRNSKGKKSNRVIYLNDVAKEMIKELVAKHPTGRLFRNSKGEPWNKNSLKCAMRRVKDATGWEWVNMTALRHSFAHAQVEAGTDSLILQSLMGHKDGRMLSRVYAHADRATENLQAAAAVTSLLLPTADPSPTA